LLPFSVSSVINLAKSAGDSDNITPPRSANRISTSGLYNASSSPCEERGGGVNWRTTWPGVPQTRPPTGVRVEATPDRPETVAQLLNAFGVTSDKPLGAGQESECQSPSHESSSRRPVNSAAYAWSIRPPPRPCRNPYCAGRPAGPARWESSPAVGASAHWRPQDRSWRDSPSSRSSPAPPPM
jgi:hypothetical protein